MSLVVGTIFVLFLTFRNLFLIFIYFALYYNILFLQGLEYETSYTNHPPLPIEPDPLGLYFKIKKGKHHNETYYFKNKND